MKAKKFVKKIVALAGSAAMLGATVGGAMAALSDLPSPFIADGVFDAYVVVGANAGISDVVAAIELAAAFAQKATTGAGEGAVIEREVSPGVLKTDANAEGLYFTTSAQAEEWDADDEGFSWLLNKTVEYNDTYYELHSYLKIKGTLNTLYSDGTFNWRTKGGVSYNITANQSLPVGFDKFDFLGQQYEIVDWDNTDKEVSLGQIEEVSFGLNEETQIGSVATVTATTIDTIHSKVKIIVKDSEGNVLDEDWYAEDDVFQNDTLGLKFTVKSFYYSTEGESEITISWETSSVELKDGGNYEADSKNWTVKVAGDANGLLSIELGAWGGYPEEDRFPSATFGPGDSVDLLNGFFQITYSGIEIAEAADEEPGELTTITVTDTIDEGAISGSEPEIIYTDSEGNEVYVDISPIYNIPEYEDNKTEGIYLFGETLVTFEWINKTSYCDINVTNMETGEQIEYLDGSATDQGTFWINVTESGNMSYLLVWDNTTCTGSTFTPLNLSIAKFIANGEFFADNLTYVVSGDSGTLTFTEPTDDTIVIDFNVTKGEIIDEDITVAGKTFEEGDEPGYTKWGTYYGYDNDAITLEYPETRRYAKITVGRTTKETETVNVGDKIPDSEWVLKAGGGEAVNKISPEFAYLDNELSTVDKPVILVGGPAINSLVASLGNKTLTLDEWRSGNYTGKAIIDLIENAFDGNTALVVAGYEADQTRIAARLLAKELLFGGTVLGDNWTGKDRIVLDASGLNVDDYTSATVVE